MIRYFYMATSLIAMVALTMLAICMGPDAGFDFFNYHLYSGMNSEKYRLNTDYFAADVQSTLNPYSMYLPYKLIMGLESPVVIVAILGLLQSTIVIPIVWLAKMLMKPISVSASQESYYVVMGLAWAIIHPIILAQIGTTYADITTAIPALIGICLLICTYTKNDHERMPITNGGQLIYIFGAGLAFGVSAGLKLSNLLPFVGSLVAYIFIKPKNGGSTFQVMVILASGFLIGILLTSINWWLHIYRDFGNPFLPFFSSFFPGQLEVPISNTHSRFIPKDVQEWLLLPFKMGLPISNIYTEAPAPDLRYALIIASLAILLPLMKNVRTRAVNDKIPASCKFLLIMCGVTYLIWSTVSANGRYAIPLHICMGLLLVQLFGLIASMIGSRGLAFSSLALFFQIFQIQQLHDIRWNPIPWQEKYISVDLPDGVVTKAALYIGLDTQSYSWLLAYANPESAMMQSSALYGLENEGPRAVRIKSMQNRWHGQIYALMNTNVTEAFRDGDTLIKENAKRMKQRISGFGYRISSGEGCELIGLQRRRPTPYATQRATQMGSLHVICPIEYDDELYKISLREKGDATLILNALEDSCPELFQPNNSSVIKELDGLWIRTYINTDLRAAVARGKLMVSNVPKGLGPIEIQYVRMNDDFIKITSNCASLQNSIGR